MELEKKMRMTVLKSKVPWLSRAHLELRRGSAEQARKYCIKIDSRLEGPWCVFIYLFIYLIRSFGRFSIDPDETVAGNGRRSDLDELAAKLLAGSTVESIIPAHPKSVIRYHKVRLFLFLFICVYVIKGLKYLEATVAKASVPQWRKLSVTVMWGPTGTGKTRKALELAGNDYYMLTKVHVDEVYFYSYQGHNKQLWWDGYVGQKTLVMDEFRGSWCPFEVLLRILDGHPYMPEQKGGHVWAAYTRVFITSNVNPESWYSKAIEQDPLFRRITEIYYVDKPLYEDIEIEDVRKKPTKYFPIFYAAKPTVDPLSADNCPPTQPLDDDSDPYHGAQLADTLSAEERDLVLVAEREFSREDWFNFIRMVFDEKKGVSEAYNAVKETTANDFSKCLGKQ